MKTANKDNLSNSLATDTSWKPKNVEFMARRTGEADRFYLLN